MTHLPEDQVLPRRDPPPLAPEGCAADWKECLDAGHENGPTSSHQAVGWRALDAGAMKP